MSSWPLVNRNKVEDSKVILSVQGISQLADSKLSTLAQKVRRTILPGSVDFNCCSAHYSLGEFAVVQSDTQAGGSGVLLCSTVYLGSESIQFRMARTNLPL